MLKPPALQPGDRMAVVSLSAGTLGEETAHHQLRRGLQRLRELGLRPVTMPNALRGRDYLAAHPVARAADLKAAFIDPQIKGVVAAIGGDDTYRTLPYLLDDPEFVRVVRQRPKLFTGFSDTTVNHLMFYQLGLQTFYGPNFLSDLAELGPTMLPYTAVTWQRYFKNSATTPIVSSPTWYDERRDFSPQAVDHPRTAHVERHHYEVLRGRGRVSGRLLGGCLDSVYDLLNTTRYPDEAATAQRFQLIPPAEEWRDHLLFLETSDEQPAPELFRRMVRRFKATGILAVVSGLIVGKPQNEHYYADYRQIWLEETADLALPILYNVNFGYAFSRTALPYGARATVDLNAGGLTIDEPWFASTQKGGN